MSADHPSAARSPVSVPGAWKTFTLRFRLPSSSRCIQTDPSRLLRLLLDAVDRHLDGTPQMSILDVYVPYVRVRSRRESQGC